MKLPLREVFQALDFDHFRTPLADVAPSFSARLYERAGMPGHAVSAPLRRDGEAFAYLQSDEECLEAYLNALYYDCGGD